MSDDNVLSFPATRELNGSPRDQGVSPQRVLSNALSIEGEFRCCLVIGILKDGTLYAADTQDHFGDTLLIMERFKQAMMDSFDDELSSDDPPGTAS